MGIERSRMPVASKIAFATAGAIPPARRPRTAAQFPIAQRVEKGFLLGEVQFLLHAVGQKRNRHALTTAIEGECTTRVMPRSPPLRLDRE